MSPALVPFAFEGREVRTLLIDGAPWFIAADLCAILGYLNSRKAIADHVDPHDKGVTKRNTLGGSQRHTIVNESGGSAQYP
jgi:anti-repressor protein